MEGRGILVQISDREMQVWASTQKAHDLQERAGRLHRSRRKPAARRHARCRRRLRPKTVRLSRGRRHGRRRDLAAPLGQMDRGPPRAFHQCGAGARSILVDRDRRRCRRPRARHARPADPRHRRLRAAGREHAVQFRDHADRPLYGAGAGDGRGRDPHQQGAGLLGARRRLSASRLRHGAADGPPGARDGHRARRVAPPQSDPGGEDAVSQAAQSALRRAGAIRQRRLSRLPGGDSARHGVGRFSRAARPRRAQQGRYIGIGLAHGIKGTGRGPFEFGGVQVSPTGRITVSTGAAAMGQGLATALAQICAEAFGVRGAGRHGRFRRYGGRAARPRRLRQPADGDGGLVGA